MLLVLILPVCCCTLLVLNCENCVCVCLIVCYSCVAPTFPLSKCNKEVGDLETAKGNHVLNWQNVIDLKTKQKDETIDDSN